MDFARELLSADHEAALEVLEQIGPWSPIKGRSYHTAEATHIAHPLLKGCTRAFFIRMISGTNVYRHRDPREVVDFYDTDHIVVTTNPQSFICWQDDEGEHSVHLELGKRYRIIDRGVLHWAVNDGNTDRIHLLIEYPKGLGAGGASRRT